MAALAGRHLFRWPAYERGTLDGAYLTAHRGDSAMTLYSDAQAVAGLALQDQVALRLGRMAMRIAAVETMTRFYLLRILDVQDDEEARIEAIIGELPFRKLRSSLLAAVRDGRQPNDGASDALRAILNRVARLEERRNALTHSSWNYNALPAAMVREKRHVAASGAIRSDSEVFADLVALDALVDELDEVGGHLTRWYATEYLGVQCGGPPSA